jgi:hypothetical protein
MPIEYIRIRGNTARHPLVDLPLEFGMFPLMFGIRHPASGIRHLPKPFMRRIGNCCATLSAPRTRPNMTSRVIRADDVSLPLLRPVRLVTIWRSSVGNPAKLAISVRRPAEGGFMRPQLVLTACFAAAMCDSWAAAQEVPPPTVQERFFPAGRLRSDDPLGLDAKYRLLQGTEVMQELGIDDDQKRRLEGFFKDAQQARRSLRPVPGVPLRSLSDMTPEERRELTEAARVRREQERELISKALDVLYSEQRGRLDQLSLQQQGSEALLRSDIADALKLTHAQVDRLKELEQVMATPEDRARPPFTGEQLTKRAEAFSKRLAKFNQDAEQVLTEDQRVAWDKLLGKKFEFKDQDRQPGRIQGVPALPVKPEAPK